MFRMKFFCPNDLIWFTTIEIFSAGHYFIYEQNQPKLLRANTIKLFQAVLSEICHTGADQG